VHDHGIIRRPLPNLLKKDSFLWNASHIEAFNTLKKQDDSNTSFSATLVLALLNFSQLFTIETDASGSGIRVVLMQNGQPIAFYGQALGPKASAQSTYHKEALAILQALKRWRHYFMGG
jgi:hypothetical protein